MTGYTCGDLFLQELLLGECIRELEILAEASRGMDMLTVVGMPLEVKGKTLQYGGGSEGRTDSGRYSKNLYSELWRVL